MNRRQKIIVSITVSTANLVLEYKDGNGELRAANKLIPNTDILFNKVENGEIVVDGEGKLCYIFVV